MGFVFRWGFTPIDDARRFDHEEVVEALQDYMGSFEDIQTDSGDSPLSTGDSPLSAVDPPLNSSSDKVLLAEGKEDEHSEQTTSQWEHQDK